MLLSPQPHHVRGSPSHHPSLWVCLEPTVLQRNSGFLAPAHQLEGNSDCPPELGPSPPRHVGYGLSLSPWSSGHTVFGIPLTGPHHGPRVATG